MSKQPYSFSFTTGTLLHVQSVQLAELYLKRGSWPAVRAEVRHSNLLQGKTMKSTMTLTNEIISRLDRLSDGELQQLVQAQHKDQQAILWLALCRRYTFIADFSVDVMGASAHTPEKRVTRSDYQTFFAQKAAFQPKLQRLSESTKATAVGFVFKMAEQAGIIDQDGKILPVIVNPGNRLFFASLSRQERQYFPGLWV